LGQSGSQRQLQKTKDLTAIARDETALTALSHHPFLLRRIFKKEQFIVAVDGKVPPTNLELQPTLRFLPIPQLAISTERGAFISIQQPSTL
jgi:hypothetical protein